MVSWRSFLTLLVLISLIVYEEKMSVPSCQMLPYQSQHNSTPTDVNVMIVADLLLLGSESGYMNLFFRYPYMAKFLRKSLEKLKPDMLVVLGDVSANGWKSTNKQWLSVLHQFQTMIGPFIRVPLHIVVGDKDVGGCSEMDRLVDHVTNSLPGLESVAACGSFSVKNVSFVSINALAMVCDEDAVRFNVEKVIERESAELQQQMYQENEPNGLRTGEEDPGSTLGEEVIDYVEPILWRQNGVLPGSGPVVLLHLPLYRTDDNTCRNIDVPKCSPWYKGSHFCQKSWASTDLKILKPAQHQQVVDVLSHNATNYLLQALKPRIVFTAHTHRFCDRTHYDGTREITVPTMTWNMRDDPGFVVATFGRDNVVMIQQCFLARESQVFMGYVLVLMLLLVIATVLLVDSPSFSYVRSTLQR